LQYPVARVFVPFIKIEPPYKAKQRVKRLHAEPYVQTAVVGIQSVDGYLPAPLDRPGKEKKIGAAVLQNLLGIDFNMHAASGGEVIEVSSLQSGPVARYLQSQLPEEGE
jgi:hypothetical protein